jgi:hypothetical protein
VRSAFRFGLCVTIEQLHFWRVLTCKIMTFCLSAYLSGRVIKVTCYETVLHSGMPIIILENQLETLLHLDLVSEAFGVILMI